MKNYLSLNERNTWLSSMVLVMYNENVIEAWSNNLTKEEAKKLKTSITMTKNALKSISNRMPSKERNRIINHSKDFEVRVLNQTSAKVLQNRASDDYQTVEAERTKFDKVMYEFMKLKCANCKINCDSCNIYEFFIDTMIPRYEIEKNCPYAYKTVVNKAKFRKEKKHKNRFDEDVEDYKYEIKNKEE